MLNADVCMDPLGIPRVPFSSIVKSKPLDLTPRSDRFHRFLDLPPELHVLLLKYCDTATLFRLMHTCSDIRALASKIFWADHTRWYLVESRNYFAYSSNQVKEHDLCPQAAQYIVQLEISFPWLDWTFSGDEESFRQRWNRTTEEQASYIWEVVLRSFPAVRNVVLSDHRGNVSGPNLEPHQDDEKFRRMAIVAQNAPHQITPYFAFMNGDEPSSRRYRIHQLWRVESKPEAKWKLVDSSWAPSRISPPRSKLPNGPLGDHLYQERLGKDHFEESLGLKWLRLETYLLYSTNGLFECANRSCPNGYLHANRLEEHLYDGPLRFPSICAQRVGDCHRNTPAIEHASIEAKKTRVMRLENKRRHVLESLREEYGSEGTEKRRAFKTKLMSQMREYGIDLPQTFHPTDDDKRLEHMFGFA